MVDYRRSHTCGALNTKDIGTSVTLSGWVHKRRDLGSLIFIDLRDRFGLTQLVIDPKLIPAIHEAAAKIRHEWVISIKGEVFPRAQGMANAKMATGAIEIHVKELHILSSSKTPPFSISEEEGVNEELRLKYRYLDIRRGDIAKKLVTRHKAMMVIRNYMDKEGFLEIQTPILAKSTPEGARDYLVPSRVYPGNFYALPQSPQIFKQLLMVSGMDRYFQIAQCFRDEDLRSDRQPEFTQVDVEMSFCTPKEVMDLMEGLVKKVFKECAEIEIKSNFPHMPHKDCMEHYGTDRPDLRFGMPLVRLDSIAQNCSFSVFTDALKAKGCVKGLCVKEGASLSRKDIDGLTEFVSQFGLKGLAWIKKAEEGYTSSVMKFFTPEQLDATTHLMSAEVGDMILIGAGPGERINQGLDHLRRHIAKQRNLISPDDLKFLWVTEFPMFRYNSEEKRLESEHHPFTSPHVEDMDLLDKDPLSMRAEAYDLVLNGYELGGGSQRIHSGDLQEKIFQTLNLSPEQIKEKFGFFVEALKYGTPPHLGIALGLDRLIMLLTKTENIRDVIAFPKTQKASDLMMQAPSRVAIEQLKELEIKAEPTEITWI